MATTNQPTLHVESSCPFSQRVLALVAQLRVTCEQREVHPDDRDAAFLKLTPTGRVPLWVDRRVSLYGSRVINEYLADLHGWSDAWHAATEVRARERLAMTRWDAVVAPAHERELQGEVPDAEARKLLTAELGQLAQTVHLGGDRGGALLALHCAPFWVRMCAHRAGAAIVPDLISEHMLLRRWLDAAAERLTATDPV